MATQTAARPRKRNDAYTGMLAISFLAFVGGTVLLYMDLEQYKEGEKLKTAPDPIKIDVPGAQLKVVPGSGTPPPPKKEPEPEMPPPEMPPPMMMMRAEPMKPSAPVVLPPLESVEVTKPNVPAVEPVAVLPMIQQVQAIEPIRVPDPVASIPDPELPPPPAPIEVSVPVRVPDAPMVKTETRTVAPVTTPSLNDEPPIAPKRFQPPM